MTNPWVMDKKCVKYSRFNFAVRSYGPDTDFGVCAVWPWPSRCDLVPRSWHILGLWTTLSRSNFAVSYYGPDTDFGTCALCVTLIWYDIGSRSWHSLGSWTTIVLNIIRIWLVGGCFIQEATADSEWVRSVAERHIQRYFMFSKCGHGFQIWSCLPHRQITKIQAFRHIAIPLKWPISMKLEILACCPYMVISLWLILINVKPLITLHNIIDVE